MIVISYGVRKSGSTLAVEMARAVLELGGHPQTDLPPAIRDPQKRISYEIDQWDDERLAKLVEFTRDTCMVIKTHGAPSRLTTGRLFDYLTTGQVRVHVVLRDPRDNVLSLLDEAARKPNKPKARTVDAAIERLQNQMRRLRRWGSLPSLKLHYADFAFDRVRGPELLAADLGVDVAPDDVWRLLEERDTRRNVAQPDRYRTEMNAEDAERVERAFPHFLRLIDDGDESWFERTDLPVR